MKSHRPFAQYLKIASIAFSAFAGSLSQGATTLLAEYEPDGSVVWSGSLTYYLYTDFRSIIDLGGGDYGVAGSLYYKPEYYLPIDATPLTYGNYNPNENFPTPPGYTCSGQGQNGWNYLDFYGNINLYDHNIYQSANLPEVPSNFAVSFDQLSLPSQISFNQGAPIGETSTYYGDDGNLVIFRPIPEPSSLAIVGMGFLALTCTRRLNK